MEQGQWIPRMFLILFSISLCFSWVSPDLNSLTVIYTVTFGIEDFPQVTGAAIVNGVQTGYYDSNIQRCIPRQQFMAEYFKTEFWDHMTEKAKTHTNLAKQNLNTIMKSTNLTSGIHIMQWIKSVEISEDGTMKRWMNQRFDGKDYVSLDPDRMRWVATNPNAVKIKEDWDNDESWNKFWKWHLEIELVERLKNYLQAGKEYFGRKVQPEVFISRSEANSQYKPLTLSCLVTGFYPVDIEVTWLRNGEVMSETQSSGLRPNHDGSHQIQKEIEINAGDEDQYSCQIEHSSLAEPKLHQWEFRENNGGHFHLGIIIGSMIPALIVICGSIGIIIWKRKRRDSPSVIYTTAHTSDVPVPEPS